MRPLRMHFSVPWCFIWLELKAAGIPAAKHRSKNISQCAPFFYWIAVNTFKQPFYCFLSPFCSSSPWSPFRIICCSLFVYFLSFPAIFELWHCVFAESCWLFFARGHGGKSHKKQNYIIAYLEATKFHGSHPSNVWGAFGAHEERRFCKHCIAHPR